MVQEGRAQKSSQGPPRRPARLPQPHDAHRAVRRRGRTTCLGRHSRSPGCAPRPPGRPRMLFPAFSTFPQKAEFTLLLKSLKQEAVSGLDGVRQGTDVRGGHKGGAGVGLGAFAPPSLGGLRAALDGRCVSGTLRQR